jgi:probable rRNA maturation factor
VDVTVRPGVRLPIPVAKLVQTAITALNAAFAPGPASLALIFSDDDELAELNEAHMGHDGPTDVLSFPLLPASAFPPHAGQDPRARRAPALNFPLPRRGRRHLGDIVMSVERAAAQAESGEGGQTSDVCWSAADELRLLVAHGTLHVCGWDHADPVERDAMRALEREVLKER